MFQMYFIIICPLFLIASLFLYFIYPHLSSSPSKNGSCAVSSKHVVLCLSFGSVGSSVVGRNDSLQSLFCLFFSLPNLCSVSWNGHFAALPFISQYEYQNDKNFTLNFTLPLLDGLNAW